MGFRFRKSINLGGGFRINLSKSGVGYSWGTKGYRVTKTARGTVRRTYSIPGTGISYTDETRKNQRNASAAPPANPAPKPQPVYSDNYYDTQQLENGAADQMTTADASDIIDAAKQVRFWDRAATILLIAAAIGALAAPLLVPVLILALAVKIYIRTKGQIRLDYAIDSDQQAVRQRMYLLTEVIECQGVWRVIETSKVRNAKYSAGTANAVNFAPCKCSMKAVFPFRTNVPVVTIRSRNETFLFLPDKLIVMQGSKLGALSYNQFRQELGTTRFVELRPVLNDAQVVATTWQYVNKSGGPDRRFKSNRQLPVCLYGTMRLSSGTGLNTYFTFSHPVSGQFPQY